MRHLDMWNKMTFVHFPSRRFDCHKCGQPFTEQLEWIDKHHRKTLAFEQYVYQRCKKTLKSTVAEEEWLHQDTVKEIFNRQAKQASARHQRPQVRVLGIDEIALKKRHKQ